MNFQIRPLRDEDLPCVVNLLNETSKASYEFVAYTVDTLNAWMNERNAKILVAEENTRFLGSAAYNPSHWGEDIAWLTVIEHPDRSTIEDALVREVEKYVKSGKVFTGVDVGSPKIAEWTRRGYRLEGGLYHMIADLDGLRPVSSVPDGFVMRSLRSYEEKEFIAAVNAGFGWERLKVDIVQTWKKNFAGFTEEWIFVADHGGRIVSAVVAKPDTDYDKHFRDNRGYLGPAATLPEHRGKNLASALTCLAMNFLLKKGFTSVALYTSEQNTASVALLQRLGFKVGHNWKFMRKNVPTSN